MIFGWAETVANHPYEDFAKLQFKEFAQAFGLNAAYRDFGGFFVVHFQDKRGVEPRHNFLDVLRVHKKRAVRPPERLRIEGGVQLLQRAVI